MIFIPPKKRYGIDESSSCSSNYSDGSMSYEFSDDDCCDTINRKVRHEIPEDTYGLDYIKNNSHNLVYHNRIINQGHSP